MFENETAKINNLIEYFFTKEILKALYYNCLRIDIPDNNDKAEIVKAILGSDYTEIGTGTNRIALLHNGLIVKIALDRRGLVDNYTEFKRSKELENYLAKTYETNFLINIVEYIEVMDQDTFIYNEKPIKNVLSQLANNYLFDDIGWTLKNSYNWGKREAKLTEEERSMLGKDVEYIYDICILDYGYLYPLYGQKDELLRCPSCHHKLLWNSNYTGLQCQNSRCNYSCKPMVLRRQMKLDYEKVENSLISSLNNLKMPNLTSIESQLKI